MLTHLIIEGMNCEGCQSNVEKAILEIPGIERLEIQLKSGDGNIWHDQSVTAAEIASVVRKAGFKAIVQSVMNA